jgi:hypothetical protein
MNQDIQSSTERAGEWQAQERALGQMRRGALSSGDPQVDAYRVVFHALSLAPRSEPPADFAERTLRAVRETEVDEHIERWMIRIAGLFGAFALVMFAAPMLLDSLALLGSTAALAKPAAGMLASPLLWAAVAGMAAAGLMDTWQTARRGEPPASPKTAR